MMFAELVLWLLCSCLGFALVYLACSKRQFEKLFTPSFEANRKITHRLHWPTGSVEMYVKTTRIGMFLFGVLWSVVSVGSEAVVARKLF
jgi:hypothetical protein